MNSVRNEEAESAIIGCILLGESKNSLNKTREALCPEDFDPHKAAMFAEICRAADAKEPYGPNTLVDRFKDDKRIDRNYVMMQMVGAAHESTIDYYIGLVKDCSLRRKAVLLMDDAKKQLLQGEEPGKVISSQMVSFMELVKRDNHKSRVRSLRQVMTETYDEMQKRENLDYLGVQTGVTDFDQLTGGILRDCVLTIAGRPGTGKTTFLQQILLHVSKTHPGIFASLEMSSKRLGVKILANETGINSRNIDLPKKLKDGEFDVISNAIEPISCRKIYIDDSVDMAASRLAARARQFKYENPDMLYLAIDYLQIIPPESGRKYEKRIAEINEALRILKSLARELDICVIEISQLLRELDKTSDGKPHLGHLKGSGAIEEMSDIIAFLFKDKKSEEKTIEFQRKFGSEDCIVTPVNIAKNKYGPPDVTFDLIFNRATSKFIGMTR